MKKNILLVLLCAAPLIACASDPQIAADKAEKEFNVLTDAQLNSIVTHGKNSCDFAKQNESTSKTIVTTRLDKNSIISLAHAKEFPTDRIERTLNGVWRGDVQGDHGEVNVDYFWIMDIERSEGLVIGQRSGTQTLGGATPLKNAPKISYLMCGHAGYEPGVATPQIHTFTKVSNSIENAAKLLSKATGIKFSDKSTLEEMWNQLVQTDYFDTLQNKGVVAFGGGLFKPLRIDMVPGRTGTPELSLDWDAQYRGGGNTLLEFTKSIPMVGTEQAQFIGTSTALGDYLVSSPGNGQMWKVEVVQGGEYNLAFDSVSIGPMQQ